MGHWIVVSSWNDNDSVEGVARDVELFVDGVELLGWGGERGGGVEEAVKYVVDNDVVCCPFWVIRCSISLVLSIWRCSKRLSAISFCCCTSLSSLHAVCQQCWKYSQVRHIKSLSPMRSMISSILLDLLASLNNLSVSNSCDFEEKRRGVEVADYHKVILNGDAGSRVEGRTRVNCWMSLLGEFGWCEWIGIWQLGH